MIRDPAGEGKSQPRRRYYAEYVRVASGDPQEQLQTLLDEKDDQEWHLVGMAGGLPEGGMILFWDTTRPSFGRTSG